MPVRTVHTGEERACELWHQYRGDFDHLSLFGNQDDYRNETVVRLDVITGGSLVHCLYRFQDLDWFRSADIPEALRAAISGEDNETWQAVGEQGLARIYARRPDAA